MQEHDESQESDAKLWRWGWLPEIVGAVLVAAILALLFALATGI